MKKIKAFFKGVGKEAKKVRWTSGKDLVKYSVVTIIMLLFFALFFYGLDLLFAFLKGLVN